MNDLVIVNANISTPLGFSARKGEAMNELCHYPDGGIIIQEGVITYAGPMDNMPAYSDAYQVVDAHERCVLPGFVDSHTHVIFGGYRPEEFEWRLKGESYMSIMQRGGGIQSTVNATREATARELLEKARWFIDRMVEMGVTTVEVKSGYGLDTETEVKMLDVVADLSREMRNRINIVSTFLGAHAVPKEYSGKRDQYVNLIIERMIPAVKDKAKFFDIFTEKNVFEIEDSRRLLNAAKESGFELKLHADEIVSLGGAELAAEVGAVSADHLLHVSETGISAMAERGVVATLLPLTAFALKEPYAPARKFIEAGCAVALATDLNPGSCFSGSIPLTIALACIYMGMSIEETITALTLNGAAACGLADITGSIEPGKSGDLIILNFNTYRSLPYYVGMNCVKTTIHHGKVVVNNP